MYRFRDNLQVRSLHTVQRSIACINGQAAEACVIVRGLCPACLKDMYKYKNELAAMKAPCPAVNANPVSKDEAAFRIVRASSPGEADFLPPGIRNRGPSSRNNCGSYGLSCFETHAQARAHALRLKAQHKDLGDFVAQFTIAPADGVRTPPSSHSGHFDLYEYVGAQPHLTAQVVGPVGKV